MPGLDKIQEFKTYVSRFRWENYQREYSKLNDLKYLYWHIVFLDYLESTYFSNKHKNNNYKNLYYFNYRLYKSFMGVFYKPHEIIVKMESRLEGFSKLFINNNKDKWASWSKKLETSAIYHTSNLSHIMDGFLAKVNKESTTISTDVTLNLIEFDHYHKNIQQIVSSILSIHLACTHYQAPKYPTELNHFPFTIPKIFIDKIHSFAENYFRTQFTYMFLKKTESLLPENGVFRRPRSETIEHGYDYLIGRYPDFTTLDKSVLTEMMELYTLDTNGVPFKRASIRAFLKRKEIT